MKTIAIIHASEGKNKDLANKLSEFVEQTGAKAEVINLCSLDLPLYTPAAETNGTPEQAKSLGQTLNTVHAHIYIAPEYNGSIPPVLNNMIAWVSRTGDNWRECFNAKPALIATHSGSGGAYVLMSMRQQLSYIGMNVLGRQLLTNYQKPLNDESALACIKMLTQA